VGSERKLAGGAAAAASVPIVVAGAVVRSIVVSRNRAVARAAPRGAASAWQQALVPLCWPVASGAATG
jgi:hypothetical protein